MNCSRNSSHLPRPHRARIAVGANIRFRLKCVYAHGEVALRFKEWETEVRCRGIFRLTRVGEYAIIQLTIRLNVK